MADEERSQVSQRFSANLRIARERAGMSQSALAGLMRELGFDAWRQNTVYRVETGQRSVALDEAYALARATRTSLDRMAQPEGLAREAWLILDALRRFRDAQKQILGHERVRNYARADLERLVHRERDSGHAEELATEIAAAERALAAEEQGETESPSREPRPAKRAARRVAG